MWTKEIWLFQISPLTFSSHSLSLFNLSRCLSSLFKLSSFQYSDKFWQADLEAEDKSIHHLTAVSWSPLCVCVRRQECICCRGYCIHYSFLLPGLSFLNGGVDENPINIYNDRAWSEQGGQTYHSVRLVKPYIGFVVLCVVNRQRKSHFFALTVNT